MSTFVNIISPFHSVQVDPKLTYHGHIKHLIVRQDQNDMDNYPFEDAYDELNPTNPDDQSAAGRNKSFWTDIFLYWLDDKHVRDGSFIAFFSDINPGKTMFSVCYRQFIVTKQIYEGLALMEEYEPVVNPKWWL